MVALLPYLLVVYAAGVPVFVCAFFCAVPALCAVRADFVINAATFCHVPIALTFVAASNCYEVPHLACIP